MRSAFVLINATRYKGRILMGFTISTLFVLATYSRYDGTISERQPTILQYFNSSSIFNESYNSYLTELELNGQTEFVNLSKPLPPVTLITAFSENHAAEGRALLVRLAKAHPDWKIYVYDIGMKNNTRKGVENACNVAEVRDIDLSHFGVHGNLKTYRWKPIIIATALKEFPVVFWTDTSTFFAVNMTMDKFTDKINITANEGPHVYLVSTTSHSTFAVTAPGMYSYLAPQGNIYKTQYESGKQLYIKTKATYELVLKWYVLCALEGSCMAPKGHKLVCNFKKNDKLYKYNNCHR